jgi:NAD(P)H-flavin reductase
MKSANSLPYKVEVTAIKGLNKLTKSIRFRFVDSKVSREFTFLPGQFVLISVPGYGEMALTITTATLELPEFEVAVRSVGLASQALHRLKVGDTAYIRGPLGNGVLSGKIYGEELLVIGGGIGLAPLRSVIHTIRNNAPLAGSLKILYGAKTPEELIFKNELGSWNKFAETHITVDKADSDWRGETGMIVDALKKMKVNSKAVAIICGPPIMYEGLVRELLAKGLHEDNIELMLERRMRCGIGKCQHCTCGDKYVCIDGPTFTWKELKDNWEAFK